MPTTSFQSFWEHLCDLHPGLSDDKTDFNLRVAKVQTTFRQFIVVIDERDHHGVHELRTSIHKKTDGSFTLYPASQMASEVRHLVIRELSRTHRWSQQDIGLVMNMSQSDVSALLGNIPL